MKGLARTLSRGQGVSPGSATAAIAVALRSLTVNVADGAPGFGTSVIAGLPQGNILLLGAVAYVQFTSASAGVTATYDGNFSVGSAPTADNALSGAEVDIIPSTALGAATAKVSPMVRAVSAGATAGVILDNTDGSLELNLNVLINDASISAASVLTANGVVYLTYVVMGDD